MKTIMVQISDRQWTMQAMHLACAMARSTGGSVVLLHLMPVKSVYLLGSELGVTPPTVEERETMAECAMIAEDYGVEVSLQPMQYEALVEALAQAAEQVAVGTLFAHLPESVIPFRKQFQLWSIWRRLSAIGCQFFTLDKPGHADDQTPVVHLKAVKH